MTCCSRWSYYRGRGIRSCQDPPIYVSIQSKKKSGWWQSCWYSRIDDSSPNGSILVSKWWWFSFPAIARLFYKLRCFWCTDNLTYLYGTSSPVSNSPSHPLFICYSPVLIFTICFLAGDYRTQRFLCWKWEFPPSITTNLVLASWGYLMAMPCFWFCLQTGSLSCRLLDLF